MEGTSVDARSLFLVSDLKREPRDLEAFLRVRKPNEIHFYARGLNFSDFAREFGNDLQTMDVLVFHMPPSLLNPNYWEPLTRETEDAVRENVTGIITREEGGRTQIWRADQVPKTRMLRDDIDIEVELLLGFVWRVSGQGLLQLGAASAGKGERFEWVGFSGLPDGRLSNDTVLLSRSDITQMKLSVQEAEILYSAQDEKSARVIFAERTMARRAVSSLVRGFVYNIQGRETAPVPDKAVDQLIRVTDGMGILARHDRDFIDKSRAFEMIFHLGRTEWGVKLRPGGDPLFGDEKVLMYYDHMSGIWAVAT